MALGTDLPREPHCCFVLNIEESDSCALHGELLYDLFADAAGPSGDDDCAVAQAGVRGKADWSFRTRVAVFAHIQIPFTSKDIHQKVA